MKLHVRGRILMGKTVERLMSYFNCSLEELQRRSSLGYFDIVNGKDDEEEMLHTGARHRQPLRYFLEESYYLLYFENGRWDRLKLALNEHGRVFQVPNEEQPAQQEQEREHGKEEVEMELIIRGYRLIGRTVEEIIRQTGYTLKQLQQQSGEGLLSVQIPDNIDYNAPFIVYRGYVLFYRSINGLKSRMDHLPANEQGWIMQDIHSQKIFKEESISTHNIIFKKTVPVTSKNQITIPVEVMRKLENPRHFECVLTDTGTIILTPVEIKETRVIW